MPLYNITRLVTTTLSSSGDIAGATECSVVHYDLRSGVSAKETS